MIKYILLIILILLSIFFYHNNTTVRVKMDVNYNIKKQWERLFKYYKNDLEKKCQGVTEKYILEVEMEFEIKLPKEFSDSFRICNERFTLNTSKKKGWFGEHDHYSIGETYYGYYDLIEINKNMRVYNEYWKDEWIAFYDYETWFYAVLDTKTGQVYLESAEGGNKIVWANSYKEWLEMAVNEVLEHGEIRLELIEKLMGIEI